MAERAERLRERWDHFQERAAARSQVHPSAATWGAAIVGLVGAWVVTYLAGGTTTAWPHVFYVPVAVAALRFGPLRTLLISVGAGLLVGPFMPLDVDAGTSQSVGNWMARLAAFVVLGQLVAYLSEHSMPSMSHELVARRCRRRFIQAVEAGELFLEYQPIIDLDTGELFGVEALARWQHPKEGLVHPSEFVTDTERYGYTGVLTDFVLRTACADVASWRAAGALAGDSFDLTVNVSVMDLSDPVLPVLVEEVLTQTQLPNQWLYLEVTETALTGDVDAVVDRLMELRLLGVRLAIDDFGTGESSLGQLQRYPVDVLKIDGVFVQQLERPDSNIPIVEAIVAMGHALGHSIIAEGIETPRQARIVRDLGCQQGQGFLFSFPMPADELLRLLGRRRNFAAVNLTHLRAEPGQSPTPVERRDDPSRTRPDED